ncbi:MAG: hypothetical protein Q4E62_02410 [Sutterellaceae bacterium]|nr:hypothetical protein [Sutterellaceae bacterium]
MYQPKKAAEVAAYLLSKAGGTMSNLKLMRLMYWADRAYLLEHHSLLTGDLYIQMHSGPLLCLTSQVLPITARGSSIPDLCRRIPTS